MAQSILEEFVLRYTEAAGGAWDEVEPQVYDLLMPPAPGMSRVDGAQVVRVAFDPEALAEHPAAQLGSFGTPMIDSLLSGAIERGRFLELYFLGLNTMPHDIAGRARRGLTLAGLELQVERLRALHFPQALYWFQATFVSDQKEQEIVPVGLDQHYARQVRHRDRLLDASRLAEGPASFLPDAPALSLAAGYLLAREECLRTLATMAHARDRELKERVDRQAARMRRYYADLRGELDQAPSRIKDAAEAQVRLASRRETLEREERVRIAELRQKSKLRVDVKLLQAVVVRQPKLLLKCRIGEPKKANIPFELVWDPLLDALEAVPCPVCRRPTLSLAWCRMRQVLCPRCAANTPPERG